MLECQAVLGFFMPGETLVLLSGFLAGQGVLDLDALVVTVSVAAIVGDSIGYQLGKCLGREWLLRYGRWFCVRENHCEATEAYFQRHGGASVFFSHFMHLLRAILPFLSGAGRMRYWRFFIFNAAGCVLWAMTFSLLGYFFGQSWHLVERWVGRASAVLAGVVLLVVAVAWLWRWVVRHELELLRQWHTVIEHPRVAEFRRVFGPEIRFLQDRLTPGGYLGLHLTVGVIVIILASWWFGGIVQDLIARDPLVAVDKELAIWFHHHTTPSLTHAARIVAFFGSPAFLTGATLAFALFLSVRRSWHRLLALVLTMAGGGLLNLMLKAIFHRHRPVFLHPLATPSGYSFPSGHVMGSTLFYMFMATTMAAVVRPWRWRVLAMLTGILLVFLIGLSRIYLGAHYLSDVLGAMAAGIAWLAFCLTAVETLRRYQTEQR